MLKYARIATLVLVLPVIALVATKRTPSQETTAEAQATARQEKAREKSGEREEIPVVRFETQAIGKQRTMKGTAHDKPIEEMPNITNITESESWIERLPALPIEKSDAVVIGTVTKAEAHLSTERTTVYSEYTIAVDEVLSDKTDLGLVSNTTLTAAREGGGVQFASGHVQTYRMSGQGFLRASRRYVLFVKQNGETQELLLLTGYQLRKSQVIPVDQVTNHAVYSGANEADFINTVRKAIANSGKGAHQ